MSKEKIDSAIKLFSSRLNTLSHILDISEKHFNDKSESIFGMRLIEDMAPFGTQIAYTCNQPHHFSLWCQGKEIEHLSPEIDSINSAKSVIEQTQSQLLEVDVDDSKLTELKRIDLTGGQYLELVGTDYVNDFLVPNCYFHLVTAYNIMRMRGVPLGKVNYMMHVAPLVKVS